MALVSATLEQQLLDKVIKGLAVPPGSTVAQQFMVAGDQFADAYSTYAKEAASCGGIVDGSILVIQKQAMAGFLSGALASTVDFTSAAAVLTAALNLFWANPLLWFPIPPALPATLVVPAGAVALQSLLIALFTTNAALLPSGQGPTPEQAAQQLSALLDTYTRMVTVTHALPAPPFVCVAPIF